VCSQDEARPLTVRGRRTLEVLSIILKVDDLRACQYLGFTISYLGWATPSKFELLCDEAGTSYMEAGRFRGGLRPSSASVLEPSSPLLSLEATVQF